MFPLVAIITTFWFAIQDYKHQEIESKQIWPILFLSIGFVLLFGDLTQSFSVAIGFLFIMIGFQFAKITFLGDTVLIALIAFLYPHVLVLLISLVIGFVLSSFSKKERIGFIPMFFIGLLFGFLIDFIGFV